jgi:hypothetical protein
MLLTLAEISLLWFPEYIMLHAYKLLSTPVYMKWAMNYVYLGVCTIQSYNYLQGFSAYKLILEALLAQCF